MPFLSNTPVTNLVDTRYRGCVYRGVDVYQAELDTAKVEDLRAPASKGFVAVEWGGMDLNGFSDD